MKAQDQYLKFVRWEEEDPLYVGYCPDLFPWGGVCRKKRRIDSFARWWLRKSRNYSAKAKSCLRQALVDARRYSRVVVLRGSYATAPMNEGQLVVGNEASCAITRGVAVEACLSGWPTIKLLA